MDIELITSILIIIGIDIILGGDNAILIALACRELPEKLRNKAIIIGTVLAIVCRIVLTILAVYLLTVPFLQFVGGVLLAYIAYGLLKKEEEQVNVRGSASLFTAIKTIIVADLVMGFDNVMAVAGAAHGQFILVIIGLLFSIPIIIWGSKIILLIMEKYPIVIYIGAAILAYTAGKMMISEPMIQHAIPSSNWLNIFPFAVILFVTGLSYIQKFTRRTTIQ